MNANKLITIETVFANMTPRTLASWIADLDEQAPEDLTPADLQLMELAIDALFITAGAHDAISLLADLDVNANNPLVAAAVEEWFGEVEKPAPLTVEQVKAMFNAVDITR